MRYTHTVKTWYASRSIMFVSYRTEEGNYGYMCFSGIVADMQWLKDYIESRLFRKVAIQFITRYSNKKKHCVQTCTDNVYRNITWEHTLKDVEEIGNLYSYLYRKYGFTNILGFG